MKSRKAITNTGYELQITSNSQTLILGNDPQVEEETIFHKETFLSTKLL
jgi:hypothetical protein